MEAKDQAWNPFQSSQKLLTVYDYESEAQWMSIAQENGWHVLLDGCALGPKDMDSFGLSLFRPDFLICSFYKVIGENPTGFGCLFVKRSTVPILEASTGIGIVGLVPAKPLSRLTEDSSGTDTELEQISSIPQKKQDWEAQKLGNRKEPLSHPMTDMLNNLINWLVSALIKLQHPNRLDNFPLVRIYGPKVKFDRGPALAFNIYDWKGEKVEPILVQKLADRNNISLSTGFLCNIWFSDKYEKEKEKILEKRQSEEKDKASSKSRKADQGITIVTAAISFLANFEDVYRLWSFIAQFLDADFVEKERWRYTALDQKTVEV